MSNSEAATETVEASTEEAIEKVAAPMQQLAATVADYTKRLLGDQRAQQVVANLALMMQKDKKLAQCTPESLLAAVMACVHLDLMPNTPEQYAFIIPYLNRRSNRYEAQFQVGYKGMSELAYRTGGIRSISASLVFPEDEFEMDMANQKIKHVPNWTIDRTQLGRIIAVYASAKLNNSETVFNGMSVPEINKIRETAKAKSSDAPWNTWPEVMALKTAVKRLLKFLPQSSEDNRLQYAAQYDSLAEAGKLRFKDGEFIENKVEVPERTPEEQAQLEAEAHQIAEKLKKGAQAEVSEDKQDVQSQ